MSSIMSFAANRTAGTALALSLLAGVAMPKAASAAEPSILTGTVTSPAGEKMGGVTVSAKAVGATITTTVFTDEAGAYYFPALPPGNRRRHAHEAHRPQQLHELSYAELFPAAPLRRRGLARHHRSDEEHQRLRRLSGEPAQPGARLPPGRARQISRQDPRPQRRRLQDHQPAAAGRRSRPRGV